jgi:hypothetical protein
MNEIQVAGPPGGHLKGGIAEGGNFPQAGILPEGIDGGRTRKEPRGGQWRRVMAGNPHDHIV